MASQTPKRGVKRLTRCETFVTTMQAELKWVIRNFPYICENSDIGEQLKSSEFHAEGDPDVKWNLCLFPNGKAEEYSDWISIFLTLSSSSKQPGSYTKFWVSIGNEELGEQHFCEKKSGFNPLKDGFSNSHGFRKFILQESLPAYLENQRNLLISCKLEYPMESRVTTWSGPVRSVQQEASLAVEYPKSSLSGQLKELYTKMRGNDISFIVDGEEFPAHKLVLSARSPVFAAMFTYSGMKENQLNRVDVENMKPKVFQAVLFFMYSDLVELQDEEMAKDLLAAADRYLLDLLKHKCELFLGERLTLRNCSELLLQGDLHSASHLKEMSADFIRRNASAVMKTDGWKSLKRSRPSLFCDILEDVVDHFCTS